MKKFKISVAAVLMIAALSGVAFAANSMQLGATAISIGFGDSALNNVANPTDTEPRNPIVDVSGRYFVGKDMAITAGFGFQMNSGDLDGTYLSFNAGLRKYLTIGDFAPFVGGQFSYITYDADINGVTIADYSAYEIAGLFGAEYFLGKSFSIEGTIGVAFGSGENDQTNEDTTYIGTRNMGVRANFYF
jgi:hypothetical protein